MRVQLHRAYRWGGDWGHQGYAMNTFMPAGTQGDIIVPPATEQDPLRGFVGSGHLIWVRWDEARVGDETVRGHECWCNKDDIVHVPSLPQAIPVNLTAYEAKLDTILKATMKIASHVGCYIGDIVDARPDQELQHPDRRGRPVSDPDRRPEAGHDFDPEAGIGHQRE